MIVVDASVVLELLLRPGDNTLIARRILGPTELVCAPHLLDVEVARVLRRYCLLGDMTSERGKEALRAATRWNNAHRPDLRASNFFTCTIA